MAYFKARVGSGSIPKNELLPIIVNSLNENQVATTLSDGKSGSATTQTTATLTVKRDIQCTLKLTPQNLGGSMAYFYINDVAAYSISSNGSGNYLQQDITLNEGDTIYAVGTSGYSSTAVYYTLSNIVCV